MFAGRLSALDGRGRGGGMSGKNSWLQSCYVCVNAGRNVTQSTCQRIYRGRRAIQKGFMSLGNFGPDTQSQQATNNNQVGAETGSGSLAAVGANNTGATQSGGTNINLESGASFDYNADTSIVEQASETAGEAAEAVDNAINGSNSDASTALQSLVDELTGQYNDSQNPAPSPSQQAPTTANTLQAGTNYSELSFIVTVVVSAIAIYFYAKNSK